MEELVCMNEMEKRWWGGGHFRFATMETMLMCLNWTNMKESNPGFSPVQTTGRQPSRHDCVSHCTTGFHNEPVYANTRLCMKEGEHPPHKWYNLFLERERDSPCVFMAFHPHPERGRQTEQTASGNIFPAPQPFRSHR